MTGRPTVASWISPKARKGDPSGIAGRGLFAVEPLAAGEVVAVKGGHLVDTPTLHALPEHLQNSEIQIAEGLHLVALTDDEYEPVMLFVNHSCEPNVGFAGNVVLTTMRDVPAGEELTTDYALFDTPTSTMDCACGTPGCRGRITGDDWRDPALVERYAGWFSRYLADRQARLRTYRVEAFNTATASSNKIHDDDVARRFGFAGGLVPGVDVFAYLCHPPAAAWGERWLRSGTITARFRTPVYDGHRVTVTAAPTDDGPDGPEGLDIQLRDPSGTVCAVGRAGLLPEADADRARDVDLDAWPAGEPPAPDDRPPVSAEVLEAGDLGAIAATFVAGKAAAYLDDVREDLPLFREQHLAHPGWLLRFANSILVANVALGPWIHTESTVRLLGVVGDGDRVATRARVAGVRERGGHQLVDLDVVQHVDGRLIARIDHTAIFRLRDDR